jgi:hypothetical protein
LLAALREAGALCVLERLQSLFRLELCLGVDLGSLCHRFGRRNDRGTHPLERAVLEYLAAWRGAADGSTELWVRVDRVRQVRSLIDEGRLVGEPES